MQTLPHGRRVLALLGHALALESELVAAFPEMLRRDRERFGFRVGQVAWRLGVSIREYRELEAGERYPTFETWYRMCKLYGWPQTYPLSNG
jgi:predicted transcriptional regulator